MRPRACALLLIASTTVVSAHHSIAGIYDSAQQVTVDGVVSEFRFINPHPYVMVTAASGERRGEAWKLELDNRFELVDIGVNADTLKPGDRIVARGSPAHDGSHAMYTRRLERSADGFWYEQVGSSPRVGRRR
jgi:hypothetical protein